MPSPVGGIDSIRSGQMTLISAGDCLEDWVKGVAPAGIFTCTSTKTAPMTLWSIGASGVPNNWAIVDYEDCEVAKFARLAQCLWI